MISGENENEESLSSSFSLSKKKSNNNISENSNHHRQLQQKSSLDGNNEDEYLENITDASIHIIVNQPSAGQGNSTNVFSLIEELNNKVESGFRNVDNKVESGFRKVQNAMDQSLYSSGIVTETDKGKKVQENGTQIDFPLNVTTSTKSKAPGKLAEVEDEFQFQEHS
ncbi:19363_t:CDS:2 [Entrophospora sp. SA101]|nr:19363_t:CDS:2 [Entrophospora sp. SA101]